VVSNPLFFSFGIGQRISLPYFVRMKIVSFLSFLLFLFPCALRAGIVFEKALVVASCEAGQGTVKAELPFRVGGDVAVSVNSIKTGCDCTTAVADATSYAAGSTGKIKLTFVVGERVGFQRKTITVKTSDGKEAVAFFQTTVPAILEITPAFVFWKKGVAATEKQSRIKVVLAGKAVRVTGVKIVPEGVFSVAVEGVGVGKPADSGQAGSALSYETYLVKITPKATDKPATARIVLTTDFPKDVVERFVIVAAVK
jgi:hypothetical protein